MKRSTRTGRSGISRRRYLAGLGATSIIGTAGCLGGAFDDDSSVVLDEQSDQLDSDTLPYPTHGDPFPTVELPDPLTGETISTDGEALADRTLVVTAFYAFCPAECVLLMGSMAETQQVVINDGAADSVSFLAITFDPERDTAEELADHADSMNIDLDAGNWHYLRPEDDAEAKAVVEDDLGIVFEDDGGAGKAYDFTHQTLTYLVNPDRFVERAYRDDDPDVERVADDAMTVAGAY